MKSLFFFDKQFNSTVLSADIKPAILDYLTIKKFFFFSFCCYAWKNLSTDATNPTEVTIS